MGRVRVTSELKDIGIKLLKDQNSFGLGSNIFEACLFIFIFMEIVDGIYKNIDVNEVS
jgi:hypothetical protein